MDGQTMETSNVHISSWTKSLLNMKAGGVICGSEKWNDQIISLAVLD